MKREKRKKFFRHYQFLIHPFAIMEDSEGERQ